MAKDDIDLDNLDYEDFDYDIPDDMDGFGDDTPDRTPVRTAAKNFGKSVGSSLVSKQALLRTSKQVLPDSYGKAVSLAEDSMEGLDNIYRSSVDELKKSAGTFRGIAKSIDKKLSGRLPSIISDKLKQFAEGEDSYQWGETSNAESIAAELSGVFGEQMDQQAKEQETNRAEQRVSTAMMVKQNQMIGVSAKVTADGINRLVAYQDNIANKFQRKSLELQYKQFFLQKELVERSAEYFTQQLTFSKGIEKNSGLPDAQKLHKSELMAHTIKQRMINSSVNKMSEFAGKFTETLSKNVGNYASGVVGGITQGAELYQMTTGAMEGMTDDQKREFVTQQAGSMVGEKIREIGADRLKPTVDRFMPKALKNGFHKLNRVTSDPAAYMSEWARSNTKGGMFSGVINAAKSVVPTYSRDTGLQTSDQFTDADEISHYDKLSRRTLTQIIPEYLSQIARWTKATYTGVDDGEMGRSVYNNISGEFTSKADSLASVQRRLFNPQTLGYDRDDLDRLVAEITGGQTLTPDAVSLLRRQLLDDSTNNLLFRPERWGTYEKYTAVGTPAAVDELVGFFRARYNIDADGKMGQNTTEIQESIDSSDNAYVSFKNRVAVPTDQIRAIADTYGKDTLVQLGLTERTVDGRDTINYDKIFDLITGDGTVGNAPASGGLKAGGRRRQGGGKRKLDDGKPGEFEYEMAFFAQEQTVLQENILEQLKLTNGFNKSSIQDDRLTRSESGPGSDDLFERYLGGGSTLVAAIERINLSNLERLNESQDNYLSSIFTSLAAGNLQVGGPGGAPKGTVFGWLRDKAKATGTMTGQYFKFWGRQYRRALTGGKDLASKALSTASSIGKGILGIPKDADTPHDVYVKGRFKAVLLGRDIKAGIYKDRKSGKTITSMEDIHGEVVDVDDNVVLTQEDYDAGLINNRGKAVVFKGWSLAKGYVSGAFGLYGKAFSMIATNAGKAFDYLKNMKSDIDLYVKDNMKEPLLAYHKLRNGEYFDKDGKVYTKWSEIKGKVYDAKGNIVASMEDIKERGGFVDVYGKSVKSFLSGKFTAGKKLAGRALGGIGRALGSIKRGIGNVGSALMGGAKRLLGKVGGNGRSGEFEYEMTFFAQEQTALQERILEQLKKITSGDKPAWNDRSGDGVRDGSAADIKAKRKADKEAKKAAKDKSKAGGKGGDSKDRSLVGKAVDGISSAAGMAMGAAGAALWSGTVAAGGMLASGVAAVGGALWTGVAAVGGLIGGAISLPVVAAVAAVAAVGYVGYKLWKRYSRDDAKILELRMAQYGIHFTDQKEVETLINVETLLEPYAKFNTADNTGRIDTPGNVPKMFLELFGVDTSPGDNPDRDKHVARIAKWYATRFSPVFIAHLSAKKQHASDIPLHELDAKITGTAALPYLEIAKCAELSAAGAFDDDTSPFGDGWVFDASLSEDSGDVESFYKTAVKFFTKKAAGEEGEANNTDAPIKDEGDEDSKLMKAAKIAAMVSPAGLALSKGRDLFDKVTDSKTFKSIMGGISGALGFMKRTMDTVKDAVVTAIVPSFVRDGWNSIVESKPGMVELVRYMTYGLLSVDGAKIQLLRRLEQVVLANMDPAGGWSGDANAIYDSFAGRFKVTGDAASEGAIAWKNWFMNRFLPTLGMANVATKEVSNITVSDADKSLTPQQKLDVANSTIEAVYVIKGTSLEYPVWDIDSSPWPGYSLNVDKSSTSAVIAKLQDVVDGKSGGVMASISSFLGGIKDSVLGTTPEAAGTEGSGGGGGVTGAAVAGATVPNTSTSLGSTQNFTAGTAGAPGIHRGGVGSSMGGSVANHPGSGTGGSVNKVPLPNGKGWAGSKDTIIEAAKMVGIDPALAASITGQESTWNPAARPFNKRTQKYIGTASGYYQVVDNTWNDLMKKHAKKYGIAPGTSQLDPRANALLGAEYVKAGYNAVSKQLNGSRAPTDVDVYLYHFLGPTGVSNFLKADPNALSSTAVSKSAFNANPGIFMEGNRERTVAEVYQYCDSLLSKQRNIHGLSPAASPSSMQGSGSESEGSSQGSGSADWMITGGGGSTTTEYSVGGQTISSSTVSTPGYTPPTSGGVTGGGTSGGGTTSLPGGPVGSLEDAVAVAGGQALKLTLQREPSRDDGTYGKLTLPDGTSFVTLELGWRNNKPRMSCIPAGIYPVRTKDSPKFGKGVYRVDNVPGRSEILIHAGNKAGNVEKGQKSDVQGCIMLGTQKSMMGNQIAIANSQPAMESFKRKMGGRPFVLTILDGGVTQEALDKQLPIAQEEASVVKAAGTVAPESPSTISYGSGVESPSEVAPAVSVTPNPYEVHQRAAATADVQSRSRDLPIEGQMLVAENLLAEGNAIATSQLTVLQSIHDIVQNLAGIDTSKDPKAKVSGAAASKVKPTTPAISGVSFERKRDWVT